MPALIAPRGPIIFGTEAIVSVCRDEETESSNGLRVRIENWSAEIGVSPAKFQISGKPIFMLTQYAGCVENSPAVGQSGRD